MSLWTNILWPVGQLDWKSSNKPVAFKCSHNWPFFLFCNFWRKWMLNIDICTWLLIIQNALGSLLLIGAQKNAKYNFRDLIHCSSRMSVEFLPHDKQHPQFQFLTAPQLWGLREQLYGWGNLGRCLSVIIVIEPVFIILCLHFIPVWCYKNET